jgi:hypothetical protein
MQVPVWLLDLDGVINAACKSLPTHAWPKHAWREVTVGDSKGQSVPIKTAQPVVDFIREIHESGRAEIRWHTTWQQDALGVGRELGLPEFAVAEAPEYQQLHEFLDRDRWWKLPAARRVLADEGRILLWTDDDAHTDLRRDERTELSGLGRLLIVCPDAMTGLCRRHLRRIDAFLPAA